MCFSVAAPRHVLDPLPLFSGLTKPSAHQGEVRTCRDVKFHIDFCSPAPSFCQRELGFEYSSDFSFRLLVVGS